MKSGFAEYNTIENILVDCKDFDNDYIFEKSFNSNIPVAYIDTNAGKITMEMQFKKK